MKIEFDVDKAVKTTKEKVGQAVDITREKVRDTVHWVANNPEMTVAMVGGAAALIKSTQSLAVNHRVRSERKRIDHTYYDPSTGMHWELKRKATNADRAEILRRKKAGKDTYTILREMNLIR